MRIEMMHPADQLTTMINRICSTGLTPLSGGSLSIRDANGDIWMTPGGLDKGLINRDDIVCIHSDGSQTGHRQPSAELQLHKAAFAVCGDIKAVLHSHSPTMITFSSMHEIPEVNLNPNTRQVCGKVGFAGYQRSGSAALGEAVADWFLKGCSAVLMENHGIAVAADSIEQAFKIFETLEYTARSELLARRLGPVRILTDEQIDVARTMGHTRLSEFQPRTHSSEELGLRRDMTRMIQRALEHHLFTSTQGTISCALSDGSFLITPYNIDRQAIQEEELVLMRRSMKEAGKMPSRAVFLHELIYHHCPDIQAIICAQPPHLMAFTLTDAVRLETRLTDESYLLLKQLPMVPYGLNYSDPKKTMTLFNEQTPAVLLENDGIIVTGRNLKQAYDCFETAESTARTQLAILPDRSAHRLTDDQLAVLDQTNRQ